MFKKLADRFNSAVSSVTNSNTAGVQRLQDMGFSATQAHEALQRTGGNVEQAAEWLLLHGNSIGSHPPATFAQTNNEDEALQQALAASLADHSAVAAQPVRSAE